jgi:radical SAM superfamily enzyme YgiQ (UPF0313 family)
VAACGAAPIPKPDSLLICISIPFAGTFLPALYTARFLKEKLGSSAFICIGGGFVNTELREARDTALAKYIDAISYDRGYGSYHALLNSVVEPVETTEESEIKSLFKMCLFTSQPDGSIKITEPLWQSLDFEKYENEITAKIIPDYSDIDFSIYPRMCDDANAMHRIWTDGAWIKAYLAHGCYWHRCAFCDTTLDYIGNYHAPQAATVVDHMERVMAQTGRTGFHFVDEALPPKLLKEVAEEILRRGLAVSFWGNIRFEKAYTAELCDLLAEAGMVAVSGGLEVASDRLLKLIDKGVTIHQTVEACRHLRDAGIMVHTYLMYGFPTETLQESVDALETVRRMFDEGIVQSAFWHRYAMTCHSPSGLNPETYGARRTTLEPNPFCNNEVDWEPGFDYDIDAVGAALRLATYNYMNGLGLDQPVRSWFPIKVPKPSIR